jgi:hypothetical protein
MKPKVASSTTTIPETKDEFAEPSKGLWILILVFGSLFWAAQIVRDQIRKF